MLPAVSHGLKIALLLGIGMGGHQVYWQLTGQPTDWGLFSFGAIKPYSEADLKLNKVYNSPSAINREQEFYSNQEIMDIMSTYHVGFRQDLDFRDELNLVKRSGYGDRNEIYELIKAHTLKLSMPCQSGTGWLLDFELPAEGKKYPLKWFIATNLHVINQFRFKENPYQASLPITSESLHHYLPALYERRGAYLDQCQASIFNNSSFLHLYTEEDPQDRQYNLKNISGVTRVMAPNRWGNNIFYGFNDHSGWDSHWRGNGHLRELASLFSFINAPSVFFTEVKNPKLVFAAVNFLGKNIGPNKHYSKFGSRQVAEYNYFKDFGVLEVEFNSEEQARAMTNNVYEKYYKKENSQTLRDTVGQKNPFIDVFAPELMTKYTPEQLAKLEDRYFIGGYPGSVSDNLSFNMNQKIKVKRQRPQYGYYSPFYEEPLSVGLSESKLTYFRKQNDEREYTFNLLNSRGEVIPGHSDIQSIDNISDNSKVTWNGEKLLGWGYNYLIDNSFLGKGASGSMVLNQSGELLGLYRMYNETLNYGFIEPLRASWVVNDQGEIILPGFDLIAGSGQGVTSYRSQIERYKPNMKTYLKSKNWSLKS